MDWVELVGFAGTGLTFAAWAMKGAIPLRVFGIASSVAFLTFGVLSQTWPVVVTELVLLPLNGLRLAQLLGSRRPSGDCRSLEWLSPYVRTETVKQGTRMVAAGEVSGRLTLLRSSAGDLALVGDARPFGRVAERWAIVTSHDCVVGRVDLAALEAAGAGDPVLAQRLIRLALGQAAVAGAVPDVRLAA